MKFLGSDLPSTLHKIVMATNENKMHIYREHLLSKCIGKGDSDERCGAWASYCLNYHAFMSIFSWSHDLMHVMILFCNHAIAGLCSGLP